MTSGPDNPNIKLRNRLLGKVQIISKPSASIHTRDVQTRSTIGQRRKEPESIDRSAKNNQGSDPSCDDGLRAHTLGSLHKATGSSGAGLAGWVVSGLCSGLFNGDWLEVEDEFNQGTSHQGRGQMSGEVVVQETLAAHEPEGEVVSCPAEVEETSAVVHAGAGTRAPDCSC